MSRALPMPPPRALRTALHLVLAGVVLSLARARARGEDAFPLHDPYVGRERPNIVMILADQWVGYALGVMDDPNLRDPSTGESLTPNLDRLASEGVLFRSCYATYPACRPNRSALLTGIYPHAIGSYDNLKSLSRRATGIAEVTRAAGYATGYIGKWHVNHGLLRDEVLPLGFVAPGGNRRHGFDWFAGFNAGHDYMAPLYYLDDPVPLRPDPPDTYEPILQTELAEDFITRYRKRPFHLVVSYGPPHDPHDEGDVPPEYWSRIDPAALVPRPNVPDFDDPDPWVQDPCPEIEDREACWRNYMRGYYAQILQLDDMVGRIRRHLERLGLLEDTILVFTSDHGEMGGSHGHYAKGVPYREALHVPWILRWPRGVRLDAGERVVDLPVSSADIPVTLLGLVGASFPGRVDGIDYAPWLRGEAPPPRREQGAILSEGRVTSERSWRALHSGDGWALWTSGRTEAVLGMYDLSADPYEMQDLAGEGHPMEAVLARRLAALRRSAREDVPFAEYPRDTMRDVDPRVWFGGGPIPLHWEAALARAGGHVGRYRVGFGDRVPAPGEPWSIERRVEQATGVAIPLSEVHYGTTYFWRVAALDPAGGRERASRVFSFSTPARSGNPSLPDPSLPGRAMEPEPADGTDGVPLDAPLVWEGASGATSYVVRFGRGSPPPILGEQPSTILRPGGGLEPAGEYFWRIDPVNASGTTTGEPWRFTTVARVRLTPTKDGILRRASAPARSPNVLPVRGGTRPVLSFVEFDLGDLPGGKTPVAARLLLLAASPMSRASVHGARRPGPRRAGAIGPPADTIEGILPGERYAFDVSALLGGGVGGLMRIALSTPDDAPGLGWDSRESRFTPVLELEY